ncbi:MAG TPA: hypothetical protein VHU91_10510 [Mycobacteriales bacterium]|jgi:hypothetical protein|nr:hypothetical protein [Mycobacteriales bacterium]
MIGRAARTLASSEDDELLHHLLIDKLIKGAIVLVALLTLAMGMVIIWKKFAKEVDPPGATPDAGRRPLPCPGSRPSP